MLQFDNQFIHLPAAFYTPVAPHLRGEPYLISESASLRRELGLESENLDWCHLLKGELLPEMQPIATVYAGHQFGQFVPQLGDGRAILLGEQRLEDGRRYEWQLKGSGRTAYSRFGDGYAVLRSSIREFLASEALAALGIPTTRALALVGSDAPIHRETLETGAVVLRIAPTFVRFGHFEFFAARGQRDHLQALADFVLRLHLPDLWESDNKYLKLYRQAVEKTAFLLATWQSVGFVHGVMNTDNMSILGLTIDYGPYAFLDHFQADAVFNHSDELGRYAFNQQPRVAHWNLACLGRTLVGLVEASLLQDELNRFPELFQQHWLTRQRQKLGLQTPRDDDASLIEDWFTVLTSGSLDYAQSYRQLAEVTIEEVEIPPLLASELGRAWVNRYRERLSWENRQDGVRKQQMNRVNPLYLPRTHLLQRAIEQATQKDFSEVNHLLRLWENPFEERLEINSDYALPPKETTPVVLSCSS